MRKVLLSVLSLLCLTTAKAQEPAICGDWIGIYAGFKQSDELDEDGDKRLVHADYKMYIRIKRLDGHYVVRIKTRIADESGPFYYEPDCQIEYADESCINWIIDLGDDYDWSSTAREEGVRIGHSHDIKACRVSLANGVLRYSEEPRSTYYDTQGRKINTKTWTWGRKISLYKEEPDW